jgi:3-oxoacyl-[acyl-carrier-protein] synthase II
VNVVPVITGIGLVTPLGRTAAQTWDALLAGRHITEHTRVEARAIANTSRVAALGIEAAQQAIAQAQWNDSARDAAILCSTSKGSVESWMSNQPPISVYGLADLSTAIAHHTRLTIGPRLTLSAACAGGLHGLIRAAMMIQSGEASRVLVVAAEASVHPLFIGSFERLGVLPPSGRLCRPFDQQRAGFLMSEAAAAVCLESSALKPDSISRVIVERFAMGGDATHLTGSDPNGPVLRHLLRHTLNNNCIDLIHAHGTGTLSNDSAELAALESVLPQDRMVPLFSHKAALGHTLGASGLVAVVINCLCHQTGVVPPNINTLDPLPMWKVSISQSAQKRPIHRSIIHAAGFGGPTAVVGLRRE